MDGDRPAYFVHNTYDPIRWRQAHMCARASWVRSGAPSQRSVLLPQPLRPEFWTVMDRVPTAGPRTLWASPRISLNVGGGFWMDISEPKTFPSEFPFFQPKFSNPQISCLTRITGFFCSIQYSHPSPESQNQ